MQTIRILTVILGIFAVSPSVHAQLNVQGSLTQIHAAAAGQTITGTITITNTGSRDEQARLTLNDYTFTANGPQYLPVGTLDRSNARWLKFDSNTVTVPAGQKLNVPYHLTVPGSALPGTHWGLVMIEQVKANTVPAKGLKVTQTVRYAMQIVTNIAGGKAELKFQSPQVLQTGTRAFKVESHNTGTAWTTPRISAEVYDASGTLVTKLSGSKRRLYPGTSLGETFDLRVLKPGKYTMLVLADDPSFDVVATRYTITLK